MDPLSDPRVLALLEQIETVRELSDPEEIASLYQDLGHQVHDAWREQALASSELAWRVPAWDDLPEHDDLTEIPSSFPSRPGIEDPPPGPVVRLADLRAERGSGAGPLTVARGSTLPWRAALDELLDLICLPTDLLDPSAMPTEASTVQWASGELNGRMGTFPGPVRQALLALLAVRARNLASYLDVDIGPRMALERLKRIRTSQELPWVVALLPNARPETGTWADDARAFWELLGR